MAALYRDLTLPLIPAPPGSADCEMDEESARLIRIRPQDIEY